MAQGVEVRVPATTANLGPAFDCIGMALDLSNTFRVETTEGEGVQVEVHGEGEDSLPRDASNRVVQAIALAFRTAGRPMPPLRVTCENRIPLARGLGSSASAAVGGLLAGNALMGNPLSPADLLALAVEMEGHPDNVAPALLGGCRVVVQDPEVGLRTAPIPLPEDLRLVLFIPDFPMPTQEARAVLPRQVPLEDAVFNLGRTALLVNALATGRLEDLALATQDRLHQPPRTRLFPGLPYLIRSALEAGALGAFLSGAGPTVVALARGQETAIAVEFLDTADRLGISGRTLICRPLETGAVVSPL